VNHLAPQKPSSHSTKPEASLEDWLGDCVADGFSALALLALPGQPPDDMIAGTRRIWLDVLMPLRDWNHDRDVRLVGEAFALCATHCERWPAPKRFIEFLNSVTPIPAGPRLAAPTTIPRTPEERREHLRRLLREFDAGSMPLDPD